MNTTYTVSVKCLNCEYQNYGTNKLEIPVGIAVKATTCPNCGIKALVKKY